MKFIQDWNRKEFYLKYWIIIIMICTFIISCLNYVLDTFEIYEFDNMNKLLIDQFLVNREGILISVSAIFIGIYFSIFTMLLTIKSSSKMVQMGIKTYKELIQFLRNAFIGSFLYIVYAILYPLFSSISQPGIIKFSYELLLGGLVLYMLLTSLRVGITYIIIFKSDLNKTFLNMEKENEESEELKETMYKLKNFLENCEQQEGIKDAEELNSIIRFKNSRPSK
ncbi:hypothetical protein [Psychrobacillus psychrodurans]|uniref:hypothetical protein n=1 Tax=Psychrobacillus psychrodurans TaxID=126157 RepID=UPI0008EA6FB6|nr:hypothetical protein [Psychrobacillus psychrodurans]MCZ8540289.1 hypothetical protein [Psychrobacillus psychrodurans]SFM61201.1 hypothetical protein SAMN05421832_104147 [Psychrobacillus psychrodurans]